ncbi:MAG: hypothetical protein K5987_03725 [Lachnospiraceae bacterium]|nr:hypothetical protein [Lachnospiraceae bacterium]
MKKRILAALLSAVLIAGDLPFTAAAANNAGVSPVNAEENAFPEDGSEEAVAPLFNEYGEPDVTTEYENLGANESKYKMAETYYITGGTMPFFVQGPSYVNGTLIAEFTPAAGGETVKKELSNYYNYYSVADAGITAGTYKVTLKVGEEVVSENSAVNFSNEGEVLVAVQNPENYEWEASSNIVTSAYDTSDTSLYVYNFTGRDMIDMVFEDGSGYVSDVDEMSEIYGKDPRYADDDVFKDVYPSDLGLEKGKYKSYAYLKVNSLFPVAGSHTLIANVKGDNGEAVKIDNIAKVTLTDAGIVNSAWNASDYAQNGKYIYLQLSGTAINPEYLEFSATDKNNAVRKLEFKEGKLFNRTGTSSTSCYYLVKLEKKDWSDNKDVDGIKINISSKDESKMLVKDNIASIDSSSASVSLYDFAYNGLTNRLEFYVSDIIAAGKDVAVTIYSDSTKKTTIAECKAKTVEGEDKIIAKLLQPGKETEFIPDKYYDAYLTATVDGKETNAYVTLTGISSGSSSGAYYSDYIEAWTISEDGKDYNNYWYEYDDASVGKNGKLYVKFQIRDGSSDKRISSPSKGTLTFKASTDEAAKVINTKEVKLEKASSKGGYTYYNAAFEIDGKELGEGCYAVCFTVGDITQDDRKLFVTDRLVISYSDLYYNYSADGDYLSLNVRTVNNVKYADLEISVYDASSSHEKQNWTLKATSDTKDAVTYHSYKISNVKKEDVKKYYYVMITRKGDTESPVAFTYDYKDGASVYALVDYYKTETEKAYGKEVQVYISGTRVIDIDSGSYNRSDNKTYYYGVYHIYVINDAKNVKLTLTACNDTAQKVSFELKDLAKDTSYKNSEGTYYTFGDKVRKAMEAANMDITELYDFYLEADYKDEHYGYRYTSRNIRFSDGKEEVVVEDASADCIYYDKTQSYVLYPAGNAKYNQATSYTINPATQCAKLKKDIKKGFVPASYTYEAANAKAAAVFSVDTNGTITAKAAGKAKIKITVTGTQKNGKTKTKKYTMTVNVNTNPEVLFPKTEAVFIGDKAGKGKTVNYSFVDKTNYKKDKNANKRLQYSFVSAADEANFASYVAIEGDSSVNKVYSKLEGKGKLKLTVKKAPAAPVKIRMNVYAFGNPDVSYPLTIVVGAKTKDVKKLLVNKIIGAVSSNDASANDASANEASGNKAVSENSAVSGNAAVPAGVTFEKGTLTIPQGESVSIVVNKSLTSKDKVGTEMSNDFVGFTSANKKLVFVGADGKLVAKNPDAKKKTAVTVEYLGKKTKIRVIVTAKAGK